MNTMHLKKTKTRFTTLLLAGTLFGLTACGPSDELNQANAKVDQVLERLNKVEADNLGGAIKQIALAVESEKQLINAKLGMKVIDQATATNALQQLAQQAGQMPTTSSAAQTLLTSILTNTRDDAKVVNTASVSPVGLTLTNSDCQGLYKKYEGPFQYVNGGDEVVNGTLSVIYSADMKPIPCGISFALTSKPGNLTNGRLSASTLEPVTVTGGVLMVFKLKPFGTSEEFTFTRQ